MSESTIGKLEELRTQTQNLGKAYRELFPKVDPAFVYDLILRLSENSASNTPVYTVEVFTKEGINPQKSKERILQNTGTHYVSTQHMSLEMLKKLNDIDYVLEVMGDYTGGASSIGPRHDKGDWKRIRDRLQ